MHAIASAIAGSLRTSTAPTGSRTLRHLLLHRASSVAAAYAVGRPDQRRARQLSRGPTLRLAPDHRASSAAAAHAVGRQDQLWVRQFSHWSTRRRARNQRPQTSPSRSVKRWPRLPLVGRRSSVIRGGPSRELQLAGPPATLRVYEGRHVCSKPFSSLVKRASTLPWPIGAAAGYAVDPPGNGHAQGRQLHSGFTRGGPNAPGPAPL
jgi:hypothetical protein